MAIKVLSTMVTETMVTDMVTQRLAIRRLMGRLRTGLCKFSVAKGGNVMLTFGLAIVPIFGFVGLAVDYTRASSARTAMQAAADSMALMLSKDAPNLTQQQLNANAVNYFNALFTRPEATNVTVTPTFSTPQAGSFKLVVNATAQVPTTFMKVFNLNYVSLDTSSEVAWGIKKLEVALALDNTGSMAQSQKMTNLKLAAHNLLSTLQNAAKTPGDVKVAIIPFTTGVNVGALYNANSWFDYDTIDCNGSLPGTGCAANNWKNYWSGCVRDRTYPYDVQDDPPNPAIVATFYPAFPSSGNYNCGSLQQLMPLTYDWTALNSKIDAMAAAGNTNVTVGLVWAWHALTTQAPMSEAAAPAPDLDKVIILLTDGDNTASWKNSNNTDVTSSSAIDTRTALVCTNVKATGIKVYTIRVIDGNASLLQSCATNPTMYYDVQQASQLNNVFSSIAQNLANLRIAK
jgi:Flp pilus assembly protein TadG